MDTPAGPIHRLTVRDAFNRYVEFKRSQKWGIGTLFHPSPEVPFACAARTGQPIQFADMRESRAYRDGDPLPVAAVDVAGIRTLVAVPMLKQNTAVGVFVIYRTEIRPLPSLGT